MRPVRYHPRFLCDLPAEIYTPAAPIKLSDARIKNVGIAGVGVVCPHLSKGVPYEFRFSYANIDLRLVGRLAWEAKRDPKNARLHRYGVAFNLSTAQEARLRQLLDRMRLEAAPVEAGSDYWRP